MDLTALAVVLTFSLAASYTDLKRREIPNALNLCGLLFGLALNYFAHSVSGLLAAGAFAAAAFLFSYAVYRLGAWAGGDVKFFTALASFYPLLVPQPSLYSLLWIFLSSVLLLVPIMLLYYAPALARHSRELTQLAQNALRSALYSALISYDLLFVLSFLTFYFSHSPIFSLIVVALFAFLEIPFLPSLVLFAVFSLQEGLDVALFSFLFLAAFALSFLTRAFGLLSGKILRSRLRVSQLKEGMIPAATVSLQGRKVVVQEPLPFSKMMERALALSKQRQPLSVLLASLSGIPVRGKILAHAFAARGLTVAEIKALKRAGLKYLQVRASMPYAPLLAAGFLLAAFVEVTWRFGPK